MVQNLIDNISDLPSSRIHESDYDFEGKKRKVVTRENFDIDDIMGQFEIDDMGNIILDPLKLRDNLNRKVNKHGYLIDERGNIVNQEGDIVFKFMELDSDEEIPQPYRFEKRRKHLLKEKTLKFNMTVEGAEARRIFDIDSVLNNEDE